MIAAIAQDAPPVRPSRTRTVPAFITAGTYRSHLKPGEIVVVVSNVGNAGMLWQADTDFYTRLAGGYINQAISQRSDLPKAVQEPGGSDAAAHRQRSRPTSSTTRSARS